MKTIKKIIRVNWNDLKSIKQAEQKKARLENSGFNLVSHFGGMNETAMIYHKCVL